MGLRQAAEKAEIAGTCGRSRTTGLLPTADNAAATFSRSGDANDVLKSQEPVLTAKNIL
jgi:hypothetical protein